ncbi:MAG: TIM barrel protein [Candidatus Nanoarchaeia archaeon]
MIKELLFGTAGIPISTQPRDTINGIKRVRQLGLGCMEIEFVRQVNITKQKAPDIKKIAEQNNIALTCHGQYYINLNSLDAKKRKESEERVLSAARIAWLCGAKSVTFHAAYLSGMERTKVYNIVKESLKKICKILKDEGNKIDVRPELTGKTSQFGDLDELIKISQEIEQVWPCIDFAHYHARYNGKYNSYKEFAWVLDELEKGLGKEILKNMHIHMSGIKYSAKGELSHLELKHSDMNYKDLMKVFKEYKISGYVISESPNIEVDALLMKKTYDSL